MEMIYKMMPISLLFSLLKQGLIYIITILTPIAPASCFRSYRAYFRQESAGVRNGGGLAGVENLF